MSESPSREPLVQLRELRDRVLSAVSERIIGQEEVLENLLVAVFAGGHALLEGVPGTAKTLMVRCFAKVLGLEFGRIQFTPDLMPSDILGTSIYDLSNQRFRLTKGPIFTELLLADEINRAPAKTQSALLEAMQERQVTIDSQRHPLSAAFTVFATQNPVEQEGTYPLPEAQLDRFLLKITVGYPDEFQEDSILDQAGHVLSSDDPAQTLTEILADGDLSAARAAASEVRVEPPVRTYLRDIVRSTRASPMILLGAGPRAGTHLMVVSRWFAALSGRPFVTPDDVRRGLHPVLGHRLLLAPEVELDGLTAAEVLDRVAQSVDVPR